MKVKLLHAVNHDGTSYQPGDSADFPKSVVTDLIAAGAVRDPNAPEAEEERDVEAEADQVLADAQVRADQLVKDAVDKAKTDGEATVMAAQDQAAKVVEDAKAEAERIKAQKPAAK